MKENILDVRDLNISFSNYGRTSKVLNNVNIIVLRGAGNPPKGRL